MSPGVGSRKRPSRRHVVERALVKGRYGLSVFWSYTEGLLENGLVGSELRSGIFQAYRCILIIARTRREWHQERTRGYEKNAVDSKTVTNLQY
jgi:hypothetical protein